MSSNPVACTVCGTSFVPEFRYQVEERIVSVRGVRERKTSYYCSLDCVGRSNETAGRATCDVCKRTFSVELASQVLNHGGRRYHLCSPACRRQLAPGLDGLRQELRSAAVAELQSSESQSAPSARVVWQRIEASLQGPPRVLSVFNHKGGTGKTTTAITVAAGLAALGRRVLLVDADGQGNVGVSLGIEREKSLYHVLVMGLSPKDAVVTARPGLDVLPSNETLAAAELYLAGRTRRDRVLADRLAKFAADYDHVVVDCSPSLSLLNQNALVFADAVLCPVACDYLSLVGVRQVLKTIKQVNRLLGHPVQLWGVLPTFYDARARVCVEALATLRSHFCDRCLPAVRATSRVKEAPSLGRTVFEHAPQSTAALDYAEVVRLLIADGTASDSLFKAAEGAER